ncbi:hypothetical protein JCM8208_007534 [Rhodotorula glutinis]
MTRSEYDARSFIEDLVLTPPVPVLGTRELSPKLELALRQYRMSVLDLFGPIESQQELVWSKMRAQQYESRGARASGTRLAVAAAKRLQDGIEHGHEYGIKDLRRDADRILDLIVHEKATSHDWLEQASDSLAQFRKVLVEPEGPSGEVPPHEVTAAWQGLVACASRDVVLSVWTEMEQARHGSATLASLARAWAIVAHKAFVASMHGGNAATSALQIDAAKHEMQELVDAGRVRRGLPRLYPSSRPLAERREQ